MKKTILCKALAILITATILTPTTAAQASTTDSLTIARTKAWDSIVSTLGGIPESVRKIEYKGSIFYLAPSVSDDDFAAVLAAGPETVRLKTPVDVGKFYQYPVYILWNSDKTTLLIHPIIYTCDEVLETIAIPSDYPASPTAEVASPAKKQAVNPTPKKALTGQEAIDYMLSAEYADAVRTEFYRLLNEHRAANGLRELEINLDLQDYADIRADEQRTKFGHTRPDGTKAGSGWHNSKNNLNTRYAENAISAGSLTTDAIGTAGSIFDWWKNSTGHNKHMLYDFNSNITMAFGFTPKLDKDGFVTSGAIFATGY